tara:strand:+ start:196 stop:882 length:687 start_codon:yes stop_codon:yes gene_type:complete
MRIFDIGYNKGEFTTAAFQKFGDDAVVIGAEPNPALASIHGDKDNFTLIKKAVSSEVGTVSFYAAPYDNGCSTTSEEFTKESRFSAGSKNLRPNSVVWIPPSEVESTTLDQMIEEYGVPDYIKIDVEGGELDVLKGLTQKTPEIFFEWHEEMPDVLYGCVEHLQKLGYTEFGVCGWFDEGDVFENATFDDRGDSYFIFPKNYYSWEELQMEKLINKERKVNYGMIFAK